MTATSVFGSISKDTVVVTYPDTRLSSGDTTICQGSTLQVKPRCSPLSRFTFLWSTGSTDSVITISQPGNYFVTISDGTCTKMSDTLTLSLDLFPSHISLGNDTSFCSGNAIKVIHPGYPVQSYLWTGGSTADSLIINMPGGDFWVTATNIRGCIGRDTVHVTIIGNAPITNFRADSVCSGDSTHFTDLSTVLLPDVIAQWHWTFGDGNISTLSNPAHQYAAPGTYTVSLKATSNMGCYHTFGKQVIVYAKPSAQFTTSTACINNAYLFTDHSTIGVGSSITDWSWQFGDTHSSSLQNPSHNYTTASVYPVSLKVTSNYGCIDSIIHNITVVASSPVPQAFSLVSPADFTTSALSTVTFVWAASTNATVYKLQIADDSLFSQNVLNFTGISGTSHSAGLAGNHSYFWRVFAYNPCNNSDSTFYRHLRIFNPSNITGLQLWLRSDTLVSPAGGPVASWGDSKGGSNPHNALQGLATKRPTVVASVAKLNGMPAILFDGTDDFMASAAGDSIANIGKSSATIFIVAAGDAIGAVNASLFSINNISNGFWWFRSGSNKTLVNYNNNNYFSTTGNSLPATALDPKIFCIEKNLNTISTIYINSVAEGSSTNATVTGTFTNSIYNLGAVGSNSSYYKGAFAEVIIYNSALSASDKATVENYLHHKYAPPVALGPDIIKTNFCPTILDAGARFTHLLWSTGDTTQTITITANGTYSVTATNIFGQISYDTINVTIANRHLNTTSATVCLGDSIALKPQTGHLYKYHYSWHPAGTDSVLYAKTAGLFWVTLTDSLGCSVKSDTATIVVDSLKTYFSLGPDSTMCAGYLIQPLHPGYTIQNYHWMDNSTGSTLAVWTPGNYSLTVTDVNGCHAHDSVNVTISGVAPVALFSFDTVCRGDSTHFTDHSTFTLPANIVSWNWDFGDGNNSTAHSPSHYYTNSGTYPTHLTVVTNVGCQNTITHQTIVNQLPTAYFSSTQACINFPYQFIDGSTAASGDSLIGWQWHFGDTYSSTLQNPFHSYLSPGNYIPDIQVTTKKGCTANYTGAITVVASSPPPTPFSLLAPQNNFMFTTGNINLSWTASANADHYTLYIAEDINFTTNLQTHSNLLVPSYNGVFAMNKTYWWKVVAQNVCGATINSSTWQFRTYNPTSIPGMKLWLKADDGVSQNGGLVTDWYDKSGNNNNANQTIAADRPHYKASVDTLNGLPAVYFDGSTKFFNGTTISAIDSSGLTLFVVASGDNVATGSSFGLFSINTGTTGLSLARYKPSNSLKFNNKTFGVSSSTNSLPATGYNPAMLGVVKTYGAKADLFINGGLDGTSTNAGLSGPFTNADYKVGCIGTTNFYKGNIAEIILYGSALSTTDRKNVETYLRYKYAPPVNLGPDINITYGLCDTVLNAGARFTNFLWSTGETTQTIQTGSGTYWVSVTDIFGYTSKDTITINKPFLHVHDTAFCLFSSANVSSGFGAGYTFQWADGTTNPYFVADSAGTFWVKVSDSLGCFAVDTFQIAVDSFAVQASLGPDRTMCQGNMLGLVSGAQQATTYLWNTGSGNSLIIINDPPVSYPTYAITVNDNNGCVATDSVNLTINGVVAIPQFTTDSACFGGSTQFTDLSSVVAPYSIVSWKWDFGDSTSSASPAPNHTYINYGAFYSTLTVITDSGCVSSVTRPVVVYSLPDVHFLPFIGCNGVPVPFTDLSTDAFGGISSWTWDFGDPASGTANTSILENPDHTYTTIGSYPVTLIASSVAGCADTTTATVQIKESPAIDFSWTQSCEGTPVFFTNLTTTPPWAPITDLFWDFGDGDTSINDNPAHNYSGAGTYNVTLTVRALSGCRISLTKAVVVHAIPQADFNTSNFCEGNTGFFYDNSTISNDSITQWHWDFDSLGNSTNRNPQFIFADTGVYHISLTVTSSAGCSSTNTQSVSVYPKPHASFTFNPTYGVPPLTVTFTNTSSGATSYIWDFGDGTTDLSQNPAHNYTVEGIYTVTLIANNPNGCSDTATGVVYVIPTILDIAVIAVTADNSGGFLKFTTTIKNLGSRGVDEVDLSAQLNKGSIIKEIWTGNLKPGDAAIYNFNAQFMVPPGGSADYICVSASVPGSQLDDQLSNNEQCLVLRDIFIVSEPYPDPVADQVNIDVVIPFAEQLDIVLYNENGQIIGTAFSGQASEGYNNFIIPTDFLKQGVYAIKVVFRDKTEVRKFVKL
ncbi:MAG: PKD domain-containing protein [Bacteroidota bacterium]